MKHLVFVYGSLKRGYNLHNYAVKNYDMKFINTARTVKKFSMFNLGSYPKVYEPHMAPCGKIKGEVVRINTQGVEWMLEVESGAGYVPVCVDLESSSGWSNLLILDTSGFPTALMWLGRGFGPGHDIDGWVKPDSDEESISWKKE